DETSGEYYLHRFYKEEPDLNIANPEVKNEIKRIMDFWLNMGVSGFRVDAAHILIELDKPTAQENEDFNILNFMHKSAFAHGDVMLLAEANDIAEELPKYFGNGDRMNVLFNFLLNQHMFLALAREDARPIEDKVNMLPLQPEKGQWLNFIRHHDELTLDKLSHEEMNEVFAAFAPQKNMQIYDRGIRRRLATMLNNDRRHMELVHSLVFSLPGIPMIRYGDEIGMGDDLSIPGRSSVRTVMQWNYEKNGGFSTANPEDLIMPTITEGDYGYLKVNVEDQEKKPGSHLNWVKKLVRIRKQCKEIGEGVFKIVKNKQP
ncbi:MAG: trehalose synthase, partial [Bacteroidales bacterium]|nr:trehalose synthase [Bacteroidales bacterium]